MILLSEMSLSKRRKKI